eukprot:TRINITY_DN22706_c0_g1_i1.p1 TRINITY_DN22706_c0_g1~~TRINITY_DN22706_c0_g1_i1.p1  ORF type:complete len:219 (+),score=66.74 TRINITY_DN22706_c0_g1_i1:65-721(+)
MRRTAAALYPRIVIDKVVGPHGELLPMKSQGTDFDSWVYHVPEIRKQAPPEKNFVRTRPSVPTIITSRMTLRQIKTVHVRYCPYLLGGDESVNGNLNKILKYFSSSDLRQTNPNATITVETVTKYQPPEYILEFNSGASFRMEEWEGAHWSEVIQALQRRELEEAADTLARDEDLDTFHWDKSLDQGIINFPHVAKYHMSRPIQKNFRKRLKAWKLIK